MENLILYAPNGVEIPLVSYANNSIPTEVKCTMEWQGDESISLRIESAMPIDIPLYSYVDYKGVRFRMSRPAEVKKEYDTLEYGIELESARYELGRVLYDTSVDPTQAALSKVYSGGSFGNLYHFADIFAANIKRALGVTWKIEGAAKDDKGGQLLSFERSENCLSALHKIAQAFHVFFFTSEDVNSGVRTIRFVSEYEYNPQPREEWNIGSELFSVDRKYMGSDNVTTRLWAFGSQEGAERAGDRLTLPSKDMTNSYIEDSEKVRLYGLSEGVYIDEEAKPTYTGDVTKETDDPYTFQSASWLMFSKLQDGETAKVHFETGGLQGMEFSVKRVKDGKITINPIVDKDLKLEYPSKDSSSPYRIKAGDTFKCLGVEYPLSITLSARDRLQASATLHYNEVSSPKMEYSLVLRDGFETSVKVGDVVTIVDDSIPQGGRANLIVQQIDVDIIARECSIQVSNFRRKRRLEEIYKGWKERLNGILDYIDLKGYQAESFAWLKGLEEYSSLLDRQVDLKEDKSNAKTKYEQLDSEIHKRVLREFFDRKIAEYVPTSEFLNRINGLVPLKDFTDLKTIVNNEISSWTLESVPSTINKDIPAATIQSYNAEPYNSWGKVGTDRNLDSHVGDTWLVNKAGIPENGKVYRFVKGSTPNTYRWVQLADSPALDALNKIASLSQSLSDTKEYFNTNLGARVFDEFNARKNELKGENGAGVRANLWRYESSLFKPNKGVAVDNVACTHNGRGVYRITKGNPAYEFYFSEFTDKLQGEKTSKVWICSFRLLGCSRPEVVDFSKLGEKNGRYYIVCNNAKKESELRGTFKLYPLPNMTFQEGDWVEFCDYKVELVEEGEPLEPTAYIPHPEDLKGEKGLPAAPLRPNLFDFASLDKNSREQGGLRIDEVTAGKRLSAGTINIHGGRDLTRVTTGVAVQLDLIIYRTARENGEFKRNLTLRTMRPPNNVIYYVSSKPYPEAPGTYHMELICPISKEQSQDPKELYIHGWLLDWGRGFMDCELRNVKVEYLYEGETQQCSVYTPKPSDMTPLPPRIIDGVWHTANQITHEYVSTGFKSQGEKGESPTPQEVADAINTADWQNQIASAAASNIIKTPTLSDKLRELVQPDTTELIKRLSSRTMSHDILSQNGGKYRIDVPAFALFNPAVEDGAAISLQVDIRQPIGSCTTPDNIDSRGYFFIVSSAEEVYTTSAEKLCGRGGEIKVYYDSYQCAESHLSIKLERANGHWIFVNYYDFSASIQADCTQIITRSYYSNNENGQELDYSPFQYLSGKKRDAFLPEGRVGLTIKVWANKWVGDVRVHSMIGESLYNTSASSFQDVGGVGVVIPAGHIGEFICINEEKIWLYTDLSR